MSDSLVHLVNRSTIRRLLTWGDVLAATEAALSFIPSAAPSDTSSTQVLYPTGSLHLKAAALQPAHVLSVKANLRPNAGRASGAILAYDLKDQQLRAVLDSGYLTGMRTAAIALVALGHLSDQAPSTVAFLGLGPVNRLTIAGLRHLYPAIGIRVWSRSLETRNSVDSALAETFEVLTGDVREAVRNADVVVTATPARDPFLSTDDLTANTTLVLAMGADTVGKRELRDGFGERANLVVDVASDALVVGESAYIANARPTELGIIINDASQRPREHWLTVFDSVGSALVDAAVVQLVLERLGSDHVNGFDPTL
jgi:ornithine cyclodeaminase/alanine dehydrogenase-like protein (mu-crystallin family)